MCIPIWGMIQIDQYFSDGLKPPTRLYRLIELRVILRNFLRYALDRERQADRAVVSAPCSVDPFWFRCPGSPQQSQSTGTHHVSSHNSTYRIFRMHPPTKKHLFISTRQAVLRQYHARGRPMGAGSMWGQRGREGDEGNDGRTQKTNIISGLRWRS